MSKLTGAEVGKVLTGALNDFFEDWEEFEDNNPGEKYEIETSDIIERLVSAAAQIGVEWKD